MNKEKAIEMLRSGLSISETARTLQVSRQVVSLWNKQAGDIVVRRLRPLGKTPKDVVLIPICERVSRPTPAQIKATRMSVCLTQEQAALLIKESGNYQGWGNHEAKESSSRHHRISLAEWELFLLLTGKHPLFSLTPKKGVGVGHRAAGSQCETSSTKEKKSS